MKYNAYRTALAQLLNVDIKYLNMVLYKGDRSKYYTKKEMFKANGKVRVIHAVREPLKTLQEHLLSFLNRSYKSSMFAHGFIEEKSIITNAEQHKKKKLIIKIDLQDFFPSITFARVTGMFQGSGFKLPKTMADTIAQIACLPVENGSLPQGGVTSPVISNLMCRKLDSRLFGIAKEYKMNFTRYADDLTFSTNKQTDISKFLGRIYQIIEDEGFTVNKEKTRIMFPWNRQAVTGIIVNDGLNVNRKYIRNLRATLHNIEKTNVYAQLEKNLNEKKIEQLSKRSRDKKISDIVLKQGNFIDTRNSRLGIKRKPNDTKTFITQEGKEINVKLAKEKFLRHIEGKINFFGQVVKANDYDNSDKYKKRYEIYKSLKKRLEVIRYADKIAGYDRVNFQEKLNEIKGLPTSSHELEDYVNYRKIKDPRYYSESFNFTNPDECHKKIKKFELFQINKGSVETVFAQLRDSEKSFWGKILHADKIITKKEFYDYLEMFQEKIQFELPEDFGIRLRKTIEYASGYFQKEQKVDFWQDDIFRNNHILPLKKLTRFGNRNENQCTILKKSIDDVVLKVKSNKAYKNKDIEILSEINIGTLYTNTNIFLEAIKSILESMVKNTNSSKITLMIERDGKEIKVFIYDETTTQLELEPERYNLSNGKIKSVIRKLYGYCDYSVIVNCKRYGWKKINMFDETDVKSVDTANGYTHELIFKKVK